MKTCTSTNIHCAFKDNPYYFTTEESIKACQEAGFECIDIDLHSPSLAVGPLADDRNWQKWAEHIRDLCESLKVKKPYAHASFYVHQNRTERSEELTKRSIEAAGILGVNWVTVHPYSVTGRAWFSRRDSLEDNISHMMQYAEIASKYNVGIALENMVEIAEGRRFGSSAEDLLELNSRLNDPIFGLCWDFGHGERSGCNTVESLRMVGPYLRNVHVHDFTVNRTGFDHTIPFLGKTDWYSIMPVMSEIKYKGEWNLECPLYTRNLPVELRKTALRLAYETDRNMCSPENYSA